VLPQVCHCSSHAMHSHRCETRWEPWPNARPPAICLGQGASCTFPVLRLATANHSAPRALSATPLHGSSLRWGTVSGGAQLYTPAWLKSQVGHRHNSVTNPKGHAPVPVAVHGGVEVLCIWKRVHCLSEGVIACSCCCSRYGCHTMCLLQALPTSVRMHLGQLILVQPHPVTA